MKLNLLKELGLLRGGGLCNHPMAYNLGQFCGCVFCFYKVGLALEPRLTLNMLSPCPNLPSVGVTHVSHHAKLLGKLFGAYFLIWKKMTISDLVICNNLCPALSTLLAMWQTFPQSCFYNFTIRYATYKVKDYLEEKNGNF